MGYTKRQFVTAAFEEMGIASYAFDLSPEMLQSALRRLDSMMGEWNGMGIRLGYPLPSSPQDSDLDEETSVPDSANEAVILQLAIRLSPSRGKTINPATLVAAKGAFNVLLSRAAVPPQMQFPNTLPTGAGNKPFNTSGEFFPTPDDAITAGPDSQLDFN